jgi:hypothetical protein
MLCKHMAHDGTDSDNPRVPPLEHTAFFDIDTDGGYVHIEQSRGDQTLYTPEEARDVAVSIMEAAVEAEGGEGEIEF